MGARSRSERCSLGRYCRRLRRGRQLPRRRISEMAAGDSRNKALERQPASSLRKSCATGGSRCCHRPRRQLFRRWWPGDSMNVVSCGGPASSLRKSCATGGSRPAPRDPAASAQGPRRTLLRPWAQVAAVNPVSLGATAAVSEGAASSRDAGFRRWQPSDSRNKVLERQPRFLRPKKLRHGTESRRHRPRRMLFRRWRPGDSINVVSRGDSAYSLRMAATARGERSFGGGGQAAHS